VDEAEEVEEERRLSPASWSRRRRRRRRRRRAKARAKCVRRAQRLHAGTGSAADDERHALTRQPHRQYVLDAEETTTKKDKEKEEEEGMEYAENSGRENASVLGPVDSAACVSVDSLFLCLLEGRSHRDAVRL